MNHGLNNDQLLRLECTRIAHTDTGARQLYEFITEKEKPNNVVKRPKKK